MKDLAMRLRSASFAGLGAVTLLLAACHRSEPPPPTPPEDNETAIAPEPVAPPPAPEPQVVAVPKAETPKPLPAPEVSPDQQVIDDADATGMTARVQRGDDAGGDAQPASGGGNSQE